MSIFSELPVLLFKTVNSIMSASFCRRCAQKYFLENITYKVLFKQSLEKHQKKQYYVGAFCRRCAEKYFLENITYKVLFKQSLEKHQKKQYYVGTFIATLAL
ncbi:MAG TPA: hypothetical protein EYG71_05130 [Leucothrix sp.]|nr:hypothetical protein [Leucothrix sp.]